MVVVVEGEQFAVAPWDFPVGAYFQGPKQVGVANQLLQKQPSPHTEICQHWDSFVRSYFVRPRDARIRT